MSEPQFPKTERDVLLDLLAQILDVDAAQLNEETSYRDVAKWDSLRLIIIANSLEQSYGVRLSDADMQALNSVKSIRELLGRRASEASPTLSPARSVEFSTAKPLASLHARANRRLTLTEIHQLAEVLAEADRSQWQGPTARIAVVGALTTDFIAAATACAAFQEGVLAEVYQAPYGSLVQEVLDVSSGLYRFDPDIVVLAPDWRDWVGAFAPNAAADEVERHLADGVRQFHGLWDHLIANAKCGIIQHALAAPQRTLRGLAERSFVASATSQVQRLNELLFAAARGKVNWVELDQLASASGREAFNSAKHYYASRLPFDPKYLPEYIYYLRAAWRSASFKPKKVLALDLDNTLWGGVIGDDGQKGIKLGPGSAAGEAFADWGAYVRDLGARGVILAICSKNNPELANEGLTHPHAELNPHHFAAVQISWDDKVAGLRRLAAELNVGLDSFVFVDDNSFECDLVRDQLPEVAVVHIGDDPSEFVNILESGRWFDLAAYAPEDFSRGRAYQARATAAAERQSASDIGSYLRGLQMVGKLFPAQPAHLARLTQMEQKTNQFNTMTRRYSETDLIGFMDGANTLALAFTLKDRHADHGLVSSLMCSCKDDELTIENWLMSCRVFSRSAENYIRDELVEHAAARGLKTIVGLYASTQRNGVVADLYSRLGFEKVTEDSSRWRLDVARARENPLGTFISGSDAGDGADVPPKAQAPQRPLHAGQDLSELPSLVAEAEAASNRQDYPAAAKNWRRIAELEPDNIYAAVKAIESLRGLGCFSEADEYAKAHIRRHPREASLYFQYASNPATAGRWEDACARWREARELFSQFPEPGYGLGDSLLRLGRLEEASAILAGNVRQFPDHKWSTMLLAELLGRRGDWQEAARHYEEIAGRLPDWPEIGARWCAALVNRGDIDGARKVIEDYAQRFPFDATIRQTRVWAAVAAGDWDAAVTQADADIAGGSGQTIALARKARHQLGRAAVASIVIYGNCQGAILDGLTHRLARLYPDFDIVPLLGHIPEEIEKVADPRLKNAVVLWEQHDERPEVPVRDALREALPSSALTLRYPSLSMFSLWPFNWPDPRSRSEPPRFPFGRYPYDGDSVAQEIARDGLRGEKAYERYMELSRAKLGNLQSLFDRDVAQMRRRDSQCDVGMTHYIVENYRKYPMFYTWGHVAGPAVAEIAFQLLQKSRPILGGDDDDDRLQLARLESAIEPFWMPIHPDVARWHQLEYCPDENAKFNIHGNWWTFKEFMIKYIEYDTSW